MPYAAHYFYATALILVLLICSPLNVAAVELIPVGVLRSSQALDTPNGGSIKQYLRSNADMTTSNPTFNFEEVVPATKLKSSLSMTGSKKLKLYWWWLLRKSPTKLFQYLKLRNVHLGSPAFLEWVAYVKSITPGDMEAAFKKMLETMSHRYSDDDSLAKFLIAGVKRDATDSIAAGLLSTKIKEWASAGKSEDEIFRLLELNKKNSSPFKNPAFSLWLNYMNSMEKSKKEIFSVLDLAFDNAASAKMLDAVITFKSTKRMKKVALDMREELFKKWRNENVKPQNIRGNFPRKHEYSNNMIKRTVDAYRKAAKTPEASE